MLKQFQTIFEQLQKLARELAQDGSLSKTDADKELTHLQQHILQELLQGQPSQSLILCDELTGLMSRSTLVERLEQSLQGLMLRDLSMAICFIDLDGFKEINDQHGHAFGDQALSLVGKRLQNSIRSDDLLCRWGGDEFVIVLQNIDHQDFVEHFANRLLSAISNPLRLSPKEPLTLFLGASIGVVIVSLGFVRETFDAMALIEQADQAMYKAKRMGKNRVVIVS